MEWAVALAHERGAVLTRDLADIGAHIRNANEGLLIKVMELPRRRSAGAIIRSCPSPGSDPWVMPAIVMHVLDTPDSSTS